MNRKALHQILALVPVVERARSEKQRDRSLNGGFSPTIPSHPEPRPAKFDGLLFGRAQFQGTNDGWTLATIQKHHAFLRGKPEHPGALFKREPAPSGRISPRDWIHWILSGASQEPQDVRRGRRLGGPGADGPRQWNAFHKQVVDVIAGSIASARVGHLKRSLERDGDPHQIGSLGQGPGPTQRR